MSASIRIKIMPGTSIADAYNDCARVSFKLGGAISVETDFNGVKMLYYHQSLEAWIKEFDAEIYRMSKGTEK